MASVLGGSVASGGGGGSGGGARLAAPRRRHGGGGLVVVTRSTGLISIDDGDGTYRASFDATQVGPRSVSVKVVGVLIMIMPSIVSVLTN